MNPTESLTRKQRVFVSELLIDFNATQAAIRAGYSRKTARQQASRLLTKVNIQQAVEAVGTDLAKRSEVDAERVLGKLAEVAFAEFSFETCRQTSGKLRALELLGRYLGLWNGKAR